MSCPKSTLIAFLFILPILFACNKESFGNTVEEKIIGTWIFDNVKFKPDGQFSSVDFTNAYKNCSMTFQEDGTLYAYDAKINATAQGYWYIDWYVEYDEDDDTETTTYVLIGNVTNTDLGINEDIYWDNLGVRNSKLEGNEKKDNGKYTYKLTR